MVQALRFITQAYVNRRLEYAKKNYFSSRNLILRELESNSIPCHFCRKSIDVNEKAIINKKRVSKYYHISCAEKINLI